MLMFKLVTTSRNLEQAKRILRQLKTTGSLRPFSTFELQPGLRTTNKVLKLCPNFRSSKQILSLILMKLVKAKLLYFILPWEITKCLWTIWVADVIEIVSQKQIIIHDWLVRRSLIWDPRVSATIMNTATTARETPMENPSNQRR